MLGGSNTRGHYPDLLEGGRKMKKYPKGPKKPSMTPAAIKSKPANKRNKTSC